MKVKFGDVVKDVKSNVDRANNPYEFYVAGDHMDTEDFRIHRRGSFATDDVGPAFVRIFHPGQVLYGSRRTYLKKVCVADFDGICANTTFVLETKDEGVLTQRLLPFLMLSDGFTDWSIKHSKGSTNPYILFSDLANYEFSLPPIDRQRELADLLWAANDLKEAYKKAISATDEMLKAKFREMFGEVVNNSRGWPEQPIRAFAQVRIGPFGSVLHAEDYITGGHFIINPCHMGEKGFEPDMKQTVSDQKFIELSAYRLKAGDVVLGRRGDIGRCVLMEQDNVLCGTGSLFIRIFADVCDAHYLIRVFRDPQFKSRLEDLAIGTTMKNINAGIVENLLIPLPPPSLQQEFVAIAGAAEETKAALKRSLGDLEQVLKGLING